MSDVRYAIIDKICPVCGKNFVPAPEHIYRIRINKNRSNLVCTYNCMINWQNKHEKRSRREYAKKVKDEE